MSTTPKSNQHLTDPAYWSRAYEEGKTQLRAAPQNHIIRLWLEKQLPRVSNKSCLEIGCYPGRYMAVMGDLGYTLNGLDYLSEVNELTEFLQARNYRVGSIMEADFFAHGVEEKFDLVYSLGFIEHFTDVEGLIQRHIDLLKDDGMLVIEAPNFIGGFQNFIHRTFNLETFKKHHLPAMETSRWVAYLESQNFEIIYAGFFGPFTFWMTPKNRGLFQNICLFGLNVSRRLLKNILPPDKRMYSPYCGVIAKKRLSCD